MLCRFEILVTRRDKTELLQAHLTWTILQFYVNGIHKPQENKLKFNNRRSHNNAHNVKAIDPSLHGTHNCIKPVKHNPLTCAHITFHSLTHIDYFKSFGTTF